MSTLRLRSRAQLLVALSLVLLAACSDDSRGPDPTAPLSTEETIGPAVGAAAGQESGGISQQPRNTLQFTRNGNLIGTPIPIPAGATDVRLFFNPLTGVFTEGVWTQNGRPIRNTAFRAPQGANDVRMIL